MTNHRHELRYIATDRLADDLRHAADLRQGRAARTSDETAMTSQPAAGGSPTARLAGLFRRVRLGGAHV